GVVEFFGQIANALDREWCSVRVEKTEIDVRPRLSAPASVRSPEHDGLNPADPSEPLRERRHQFALSGRELFHSEAPRALLTLFQDCVDRRTWNYANVCVLNRIHCA